MRRSSFVGIWLTLLACGNHVSAQSIEGVHRITDLGNGIYVAEPRFGSANATIIINDDHVVLVDPHSGPASANALIGEVRALTDRQIRFVINTHWHGDHHGGNRALEEAFPNQITFIAHPRTRENIPALATPELRAMAGFYATFAKAASNWLKRGHDEADEPLSAAQRSQIESYITDMEAFAAGAASYEYRLPELTVEERLTLHSGQRSIEIRAVGRAHTDGDLYVYLPEERVLIAGDLLTAPYVVPRSGYPADYAEALRELAAIDADRIVLGHGGPVKRDARLALLMADLLETTASHAAGSRDAGRDLQQAIAAAIADAQLRRFEARIDWEEPGLRFLNFDRLLAMTVTRVYETSGSDDRPR